MADETTDSPSFALTDALGPGEQGRLVQLSHSAAPDEGYRTNLGFATATNEIIEVGVELYRGDGSLIGTRSYALLPYTYFQEANVFAAVTSEDVEQGFAVVRSDSDSAAYFAFASVVDNRSGDPIYIPAQPTP